MNLTLDELRRTIDLACAGRTHIHLQQVQGQPGAFSKLRAADQLIDRLMEEQRLESARNNIGSSPNTPESSPEPPLFEPSLLKSLHTPISPGVSIVQLDEDIVHGNPDDPENVAADSEFIIRQVQERASLFVQDNSGLNQQFFTARTDDDLHKAHRLIETAMLIGASIAMERSSSKLLGEHLSQLASTQSRVRGDACCDNERRNMSGGCDNCGAPSL